VESNITKNIFKLNSQVPETIMFGNTFDISALCQYGFYDWINILRMCNTLTRLCRSRNISVINGVGLVLASKILQDNKEVVIRFMFRGLTDAKIVDPVQARIVVSGMGN